MCEVARAICSIVNGFSNCTPTDCCMDVFGRRTTSVWFRSYLRLRDDLTQDRSKNILLMQKALQQMNVQLHHVLSDITGESGLAIIRAIVDGERDPFKLVRMVNARVKAKPAK